MLRDRDTNGNGTLDERLYALADANYNVTAVVDTAGAVVERFGYEAYGRAEVLAANWQAAADGYDWEVRYAGYRWDSESGLYPVRLGGAVPVSASGAGAVGEPGPAGVCGWDECL